MYRFGNRIDLYPMVYEFSNLYAAYLEVARGKRFQREFQTFDFNLEENLIEIQNELIWKTYKPGGTVSFYVYEPKERYITRPQIFDRIVHHALIRVVKPYYYRIFDKSSYACQEKKGQLAACTHLSSLQRSAIGKFGFHFGVTAIDIHHFFQSIDFATLKVLVGYVFQDDSDIIWLFYQIIDAVDEGIPIGFLPSQYNANLVGTALDYYLARTPGAGYRCRYMDDLRIYSRDIDSARAILFSIDEFCSSRLMLTLNLKKSRTWTFAGKDTFCGYVVGPHHLEAKRSTVKRGERRIHKKIGEYQAGKLSGEKLYQSAKNLNDYLSHTIGKPSNRFADKAILIGREEMKKRRTAG